MNRYMKLVHWEITRSWKMFAVLALLTILLQCGGVLNETHKYVGEVNNQIQLSRSTLDEYVQSHGKLSFVHIFQRATLWFYAPIALCIGGIAFYLFLIWYKEWFGKNMFIYRLLMIPAARRKLYAAKLTAILMLVFGLIALQIVLLPLENKLFILAGGETLLEPSRVLELTSSNRVLVRLLPPTFTDFVIYYGAGIIVVLVCFTSVMLERSYRLKGALAAVVYVIAVVLVMRAPYLLLGQHAIDNYLYPIEYFEIEVALGLLVGAVTLWLGLHLIAKKVSV